MEYLLTFEDGSAAYLTHHGVKGMHWGVWNAETKLKYGNEGKIQQQGGGGNDDEEVDEDGYTQSDREEMAGIKPWMTKEEAKKHVTDLHNKYNKLAFESNSKRGNVGNTEVINRQRQGYLYDLATANKHKMSIGARAAEKSKALKKGKAATDKIMSRFK